MFTSIWVIGWCRVVRPVRYNGVRDVTAWLVGVSRDLPAIVPAQPGPDELLVGLGWVDAPRLFVAEDASVAMAQGVLWYRVARDEALQHLS